MKAKEVLNILQITRPTLTKYVKEGLIKVDSTINGQYVYNDESVYKLINNQKNAEIKTEQKPEPAPKKKETSKTQDKINLLKECFSESVVIFDFLQQIRLLTPQAIAAKDKIIENLKLLDEME